VLLQTRYQRLGGKPVEKVVFGFAVTEMCPVTKLPNVFKQSSPGSCVRCFTGLQVNHISKIRSPSTVTVVRLLLARLLLRWRSSRTIFFSHEVHGTSVKNRSLLRSARQLRINEPTFAGASTTSLKQTPLAPPTRSVSRREICTCFLYMYNAAGRLAGWLATPRTQAHQQRANFAVRKLRRNSNSDELFFVCQRQSGAKVGSRRNCPLPKGPEDGTLRLLWQDETVLAVLRDVDVLLL